MSITPELYEFIVKIVEDKVREIKVTRKEFDKLTSAVKDLAEKINTLAGTLNILSSRVDMLAEAQARTEEALSKLSGRVDALAEAQRRTEEQLNTLAKRVDMLAEAQARTEGSVQQLSNAVRELAVQVGRLSDTVGFGLEDIARVMVPGWFERHMNIYVEDLTPTFINIDGEEVQINLFGIGKRDSEEIVIVGECKSRIYAREVRQFLRMLEKVRRAFPDKDVLGFLFGYLVHPSAQVEAEKHKVKVIATYMR
ncbi:MAG: hypothetical protein ACTSYM_04720 [Candidatus Baldrarchaeia archaeon]